jgi:hypothetical protein
LRTCHFLLPALLIILQSACSNSPELEPADPLEQVSAISVTLPGFDPVPGTALHWHRELVWVDDPEGRFGREAVVLQRALQDEFERKGYRFEADDEAADYDVVGVAMLGALEDHAEVQEFFRLYPALAKPAEGYGLGTVLVAITPANSSKVVWRGALELYTDRGMVPAGQQEQRLQWAAAKLLESIPTLY